MGHKLLLKIFMRIYTRKLGGRPQKKWKELPCYLQGFY